MICLPVLRERDPHLLTSSNTWQIFAPSITSCPFVRNASLWFALASCFLFFFYRQLQLTVWRNGQSSRCGSFYFFLHFFFFKRISKPNGCKSNAPTNKHTSRTMELVRVEHIGPFKPGTWCVSWPKNKLRIGAHREREKNKIKNKPNESEQPQRMKQLVWNERVKRQMPFPCELPKWEPTENGDTLHTHTHHKMVVLLWRGGGQRTRSKKKPRKKKKEGKPWRHHQSAFLTDRDFFLILFSSWAFVFLKGPPTNTVPSSPSSFFLKIPNRTERK